MCIKYKEAVPLLIPVVAGSLVAACVLVVFIVLVIYCVGRKWVPQTGGHMLRTPDIPLRAVNHLTVGALVGNWRHGYRRNLSVIRDNDVPSQTPRYPINPRQSYLHTRDSATYNYGAYDMGAGKHYRYLRPSSQYKPNPLYENMSYIKGLNSKPSEYLAPNQQHDRRRGITNEQRPVSVYPEDPPVVLIRRPKIRRQDTQSIYPNDV